MIRVEGKAVVLCLLYLNDMINPSNSLVTRTYVVSGFEVLVSKRLSYKKFGPTGVEFIDFIMRDVCQKYMCY
jgi:hypothetical protein